MLRDVFPYLLRDGQIIESATIWEVSRICTTQVRGQSGRAKANISYILADLLVGIGDVAILAGLTQIVAVFDARILRMLKSAGCNPQTIGTPRRIGDTMSYAGIFDMHEFISACGADRAWHRRFCPCPPTRRIFGSSRDAAILRK